MNVAASLPDGFALYLQSIVIFYLTGHPASKIIQKERLEPKEISDSATIW